MKKFTLFVASLFIAIFLWIFVVYQENPNHEIWINGIPVNFINRNANFENGKLMERVKALIPILVPLFISAFRRADELATAMECRCYHGGEGRTKMKLLRYKRFDLIAFAVAILLGAAVIILGEFGL